MDRVRGLCLCCTSVQASVDGGGAGEGEEADDRFRNVIPAALSQTVFLSV